MNLKDKVLFISDGDSDLGRYIAEEATYQGAKVVINFPSGQDTNESMQKCGTSESEWMVTHSDLLNGKEVDKIFQSIVSKFKKIDILVHNQNQISRQTIEECDEKIFTEMMDINAKTGFLCTQAAGRYMDASKCGKIIYISTIHDEKPTGCAFTYSLSKGALKMLCKEAAVTLGRKGIQTNLIELGSSENDDKLFESGVSNLYKNYEYKIPMGSFISYKDVVNLVLFLGSDESIFLNGANICMDGGFLLNYTGSNHKNELVKE